MTGAAEQWPPRPPSTESGHNGLGHRIAIRAYGGVAPFDLSVPIEVFGRARLPDDRPAYEVRVCGPTGEVDAGLITIRTPYGLDTAVAADTVVIPGSADV